MMLFLTSKNERNLFVLWFLVVFCVGFVLPRLDADAVDVTWDVKPKQYLRYGKAQKKEVFDVFGYELTGELPVPHPSLAIPKENVPEYFALVLPDRKLEMGKTFQYERSLTMQKDHRFYPFIRWVPDHLIVRGELKETVQLNGVETVRIHQTMVMNMTEGFLSRMKVLFSGNWTYCEHGEMEVDLWYDPKAGLLRKIQYSADLSFRNVNGDGENSVKESETYTLTEHHQIGGSFEDTSFQQRVKDAIQKGVEYLKQQQSGGGSWSGHWEGHEWGYPFGETALATFTLLKCDVEKDDPAVKRAMEELMEQSPGKTYSSVLSLMVMDAFKQDPFLRKMEQKFLIGEISEQELNDVRRSAREEKKLTKTERDWLQDHLRFLIKQNQEGAWTYPQDRYDDMDPDHSNTQYAALGLHAAGRLGANVPIGVWKQTMKRWLTHQAEEGHSVDLTLNVMGSKETHVQYDARARGWSYYQPATPESASGKKVYGELQTVRIPMIAGGIGSLQLAMTNLAKENRLPGKYARAGRQAILDGWAWLQAHWTLRPHPNPTYYQPGWMMNHYYTLYALERAGMFTRTRSIGEHNWYQEGAELILSRQRKNGSWSRRIASTCFALLFLKRATSTVQTLGR